jgi:hypothetical protein
MQLDMLNTNHDQAKTPLNKTGEERDLMNTWNAGPTTSFGFIPTSSAHSVRARFLNSEKSCAMSGFLFLIAHMSLQKSVRLYFASIAGKFVRRNEWNAERASLMIVEVSHRVSSR